MIKKLLIWIAFLLLPMGSVLAQLRPEPMLSIDLPPEGETVDLNFLVMGWAVDPRAGVLRGPGVDIIRVYEGNNCGGRLLGEGIPTISRPDITASFESLDDTYLTTGFVVPVAAPAEGDLRFTLCVRSTVTNQFELQASKTVTVKRDILSFVIDRPQADDFIPPSFTLEGWTLDPEAPAESGAGIDLVSAYRGDSCEGTLLGETEINVERPDIPPFLNVGEQFLLSGYRIEIEEQPLGPLTFTVCARSSTTGEILHNETRFVTLTNGLLTLDSADNPAIVRFPFAIRGWAVDPDAGSDADSGVDLIRIYNGERCEGRVIADGVPFIERPDVIANLGFPESFLINGFEIILNDPPPSIITYTACAFSLITGEVSAKDTKRLSRHPLFIDEPAQGAELTQPFVIRGWSVDPSAGVGRGTGVDLVRVFAGESCEGQALAEAAPFMERPEILSLIGQDESYTRAGYSLILDELPLGGFTFSVCAMSSVTGGFSAIQTRSVTLIEAEE